MHWETGPAEKNIFWVKKDFIFSFVLKSNYLSLLIAGRRALGRAQLGLSLWEEVLVRGSYVSPVVHVIVYCKGLCRGHFP